MEEEKLEQCLINILKDESLSWNTDDANKFFVVSSDLKYIIQLIKLDDAYDLVFKEYSSNKILFEKRMESYEAGFEKTFTDIYCASKDVFLREARQKQEKMIEILQHFTKGLHLE